VARHGWTACLPEAHRFAVYGTAQKAGIREQRRYPTDWVTVHEITETKET
jgi:hypothetical protein